MGQHLKQRVQRKVYHRIQDAAAIGNFLAAVFNSYRLAELLPLTPLLLCLGLLSMFPDWVSALRLVPLCIWSVCGLLSSGPGSPVQVVAGCGLLSACVPPTAGAACV